MRAARVGLGAIALTVLLRPGGVAGADSYTVRPGDTLATVAARAGVDVGRLAATNGIADPNRIMAGQRLTLSSGSYRVRPGDTLFGLAPRLGVSESSLVAANRLADPDLITVGQTLVFAGTSGPTTAASSRAAARAATRAVTAVGAPAPRLRPADAPVVTVNRPWACPVPGAHFTNDFGYVRADGTPHQGVDVYAPRHAPVLAPVSGVVAAFPNHLGGNAFELYGDDGNRYYGAHLDAYGRTGRVAAGTVIGFVGNTGDAVGGPTHLHFEVHPRGAAPAASPFPLLSRACR